MLKRPAICPITYLAIELDHKYSMQGLRLLSPKLYDLKDFPYTSEQQIIEARKRADKMSIQGVQPKLSAKLDLKNQGFSVCDLGGTYILKPQNVAYQQLPENEDLTMRLAQDIIEVPLHGLLYAIDGSFTYFIKRYDRLSRGNKLAVEDFGQLSGLTRDTKYDYSMEKIVTLVEKYCTFPVIEKSKLFTRVIFNYLIGNEDMHLKNFSLITRNAITQLAPAYDFINTTLAIGNPREQIALPLNGKKNNLTRKDLVEYYGCERLGLNLRIVADILKKISGLLPRWHALIERSFLSAAAKDDYRKILDQRVKILNL